ncbi:MAG TPA: hypothetical protein VGE36_13395, partial [Roseateles sp.]
ALADYLLAQGGPDSAAARARLQDRARTSTDPMLTVLALHMPCVQPGCRNIETSQWSRLEPANLLAWLALPGGGANGRYLLDQIAEHVRYTRSYRQEAAALFDGLPGLALRPPWAVAHLYGLTASCRRPLADAAAAPRCEAVAELLWADGGATERLIALVLVQGALPLLPQRGAVWEPRQREMEAVTRWLGEERSRLSTHPRPTRAEICEALAPPRPGERAALNEWERARILLQASGLSPWELYPRRALPGRSVP